VPAISSGGELPVIRQGIGAGIDERRRYPSADGGPPVTQPRVAGSRLRAATHDHRNPWCWAV